MYTCNVYMYGNFKRKYIQRKGRLITTNDNSINKSFYSRYMRISCEKRS